MDIDWKKRAEAAERERDEQREEYDQHIENCHAVHQRRVEELEKALAERGHWKNCDCAGRWHDPRCAPKGGSE